MKKAVQNNITDRRFCDRFLDSRKLQVSYVLVTGCRKPMLQSIHSKLHNISKESSRSKLQQMWNEKLFCLQFLCKTT